jgi:hypothetical protein
MFGVKSKATIAAEPLFDPKGERIKVNPRCLN